MKHFFTILGLLIFCNLNAQQELVNKNATQDANELYQYISNLDGKILAGQHSYNQEPSKFYDLAQEIGGKFPAVWGADFYWSGNSEDPGERVVNAAIEKYKEGTIITLMWHVGRPMDDAPYGWKESVQNKITDAQWNDLITPGTEIHTKWLNQIDHLAISLKKLQKAGIPVLWRPYHEMNGVWFWWGNRKGANGYAKLWQMLYDRYVNYHKLNNLIWVWNANAPRDIPFDEAFDYIDFYPGHNYVDILATDVYNFDYEQKDYNQLLELAEGKPIALGEVGQLPKINILEAQPKWSWFMVWSNWLQTANSPDRVKEVYEYKNTITRDELHIKK